MIAAAFGNIPQRVLNDVDAAQIGAFAGGAGILILSGTGSMAWARDAAGRSYRVGGWGETIGDEGSSHWIGRRVLGLVSQSIDGRAAPTPLVDAVFEHLQLDRTDAVNALEGWVSRLKKPRSGVAALAHCRSPCRTAGDAGAMAIYRSGSRGIGATCHDHRAACRPSHGVELCRRNLQQPYPAGGRLHCASGGPPRPPFFPIGGALLAAAQRPRLADAPGLGRASCRLDSGTCHRPEWLNNKPGEQGHAQIHPIDRCSDGARRWRCRPSPTTPEPPENMRFCCPRPKGRISRPTSKKTPASMSISKPCRGTTFAPSWSRRFSLERRRLM